MKLLLLGARGQLGWELQRALAPLGELMACDRDGHGGPRADLADTAALQALVGQLAPQVIVNAAAYTAVDRAESEPDLAHTVNAAAPGVLARAAAASGAWLVHYSTDYVFDGSGNTARDEDAATGPLSVYGRSKLAGEQAIGASGCRHLILRTSWVHAARGGNFVRTMLRLAGEREALSVVADQIGAPTSAELLADVSAHALRAAMARPGLGGTYHCTAAGETSWHGYAAFVFDWARRHGHRLRLPPAGLRAITSADFPTPAQRPLNSRLDCRRLERRFDLVLPPWQHGVERLLTEVLGSAPAPGGNPA